jgi:hypothetical protein
MPYDGQYWEYRKSPKYKWRVPDKYLNTKDAIFHAKMAWKIVRGEIRGSDTFWLASVAKDEYEWLGDGDHEFHEDVFESGERFRLIYDPVTSAGVYCTQCGIYCEYANWAKDFQCWACENGY